MYLMCMVCLSVHTQVYKHEIETAARGLFVCLFEREMWMTSHRSELRRFRSTGGKNMFPAGWQGKRTGRGGTVVGWWLYQGCVSYDGSPVPSCAGPAVPLHLDGLS